MASPAKVGKHRISPAGVARQPSREPQLRDLDRRFLLRRREDVQAGVQGDRNGSMTQVLGDDLGMDAGLQHVCSMPAS